MSNGDKKYHAEIKLSIEGREARINVFADTLNEIYNDIGHICSQFQPEWKNPARQEVMNNVNALINSQGGRRHYRKASELASLPPPAHSQRPSPSPRIGPWRTGSKQAKYQSARPAAAPRLWSS